MTHVEIDAPDDDSTWPVARSCIRILVGHFAVK
jgi:hypothetical protein